MIIILGQTLAVQAAAQASSSSDWSFGGHAKYQYIHTRIPEDSVLQSINGDSLQHHHIEVRQKTSARHDRWDFNMHLQFIGIYSDILSGIKDLPQVVFPGAGIINADRRWFNFTHQLTG